MYWFLHVSVNKQLNCCAVPGWEGTSSYVQLALIQYVDQSDSQLATPVQRHFPHQSLNMFVIR